MTRKVESIASTSTAFERDQVAEPLLQRALHEELRRRRELGAVGREHELHEAAAEVGPHHALAGRGEQHLLDEAADVRRFVGFGGAAAAVELVGKARFIGRPSAPDDAGLRRDRQSGVPFGTQTAWLSISTTGWPFENTRSAATTHCPVTHGTGPPLTLNGQPATAYGAVIVDGRLAAHQHARIGRRRHRAAAMCADHRSAEMEERPGHRHTTVSAPLLTVIVGPISVIIAPLPFWM